MQHKFFSFLVFCMVAGMSGCKAEAPAKQEAEGQAKLPPSPQKSVSEESKPSADKEKPRPVEKKEVNLQNTEKPEADQTAPDKFAVKLQTTKSDIIIDVHRKWAPKAADRFYTLVKLGFYNDIAFFRVIKGFMAQTGLSGEPDRNAKWRENKIKDDPAVKSNTKGMVTFATSGPNSRTTQFFINFGDNSRLDSMGFAPFAKVRDMSPAGEIESHYGEGAPRGLGPNQGRIQREGNTYLKKYFPKLDYILTASILEE